LSAAAAVEAQSVQVAVAVAALQVVHIALQQALTPSSWALAALVAAEMCGATLTKELIAL
jgi:aspartate-semialdehyde dehydrogenase